MITRGAGGTEQSMPQATSNWPRSSVLTRPSPLRSAAHAGPVQARAGGSVQLARSVPRSSVLTVAVMVQIGIANACPGGLEQYTGPHKPDKGLDATRHGGSSGRKMNRPILHQPGLEPNANCAHSFATVRQTTDPGGAGRINTDARRFLSQCRLMHPSIHVHLALLKSSGDRVPCNAVN